MKAKTKFLKMYNSLPDYAKLLVWTPYGKNPMTLHVIAEEVKHDTKLGYKVLKEMRYEDT